MSDYGSTPPPPLPPMPAYGPMGTQGIPPKNYLVWSILTVLICWPLAIPSIIFAAQVNGKWAAGDVAGAQVASARAKKFATWATVVGVILIIISIVSAAMRS